MKAAEEPLKKIIELSEVLQESSHLNRHHRRVLHKIMTCRTEKMGVTTVGCSNPDCGHVEVRYKSCRNRMCPSCGWSFREKWRLQRMNDLIPDVPHFHNVYKIPYEFSQLAADNQREMQTILFHSVRETLSQLCIDRHGKGAKHGYSMVLHSWDSSLGNHYHIHAVISGVVLKGDEIIQLPRYLYPAHVQSKVFKGIFCSKLRELHREGKLKFFGRYECLRNPSEFGRFVDRSYRYSWHVHTEVTRGETPEKLIGYLANYVHRTAISNGRICSVSEDGVTFLYRKHGEEEEGQMVPRTFPLQEFMRRYVSHIQPQGYVRIRHCGFLGSGVKNENLKRIFARKDREYKVINIKIQRMSCDATIEAAGKDLELMRCPCCGSRMLYGMEWIAAMTMHHDPPEEKGEEKQEAKVA